MPVNVSGVDQALELMVVSNAGDGGMGWSARFGSVGSLDNQVGIAKAASVAGGDIGIGQCSGDGHQLYPGKGCQLVPLES